jgi:hypothetical protein
VISKRASSNTDPGDCCSPLCEYEPPGTACGDPADTVCDDPDACDAAGSCLPNYEPPTTECRADAGECDLAELCDGAGVCPGDGFEPPGTVCGDPANTICDNPDACDAAGSCLPNHEPQGAPCPDNDFCNGEERCDFGVCLAEMPANCDDRDLCTADSCDEIEGCVNDPIPGCEAVPVPTLSIHGRLLFGLLLLASGSRLAQRRRLGDT